MSQPRTSYVSYGSLQTQRLLLAGLVMGLIAVMLGILFEVYYRGAQATQISPAIRRLAEPLNPVLDTDVLSQVEGYEQLSLEQIRAQFAGAPPAQLISRSQPEVSTATTSAQLDPVEQAIQDTTLTEDEALSDEELNSLLDTEPTATEEAQL